MTSYYPMVKNSAQRIVFPILDADGDPVSSAAGLDSERSIDGATFADCTNEATEIATSSGVYYLDLTAAETNGDVIAVIVKTSTSGAKTTVLVFYTSTQSLDTVDSNVDAIKTKTDQLNFTGTDVKATLNGETVALSSATETQIDNIETDTNEIQGKLPTNNIMGSSVLTDKDDEIDAIKAKTDLIGASVAPANEYDTQLDQNLSTTESNIRGGTETLETLKSAIGAIQNNTRFTAAVPKYMCKPDAGNEAFKWTANLYDTSGGMEDPDDNEIIVRVMQDDGTYLYNLYKEVGLTNLLDNATDTTTWPAASGWRAMERDAIGRYFAFYKTAHDATEETLTVEFGWEESGTEGYQTRSTEVADVHGDLSAILADTNELQTDWVNGGRLDLLIDAIKTVTDNLPDGGALTTIQADLDNPTQYKATGFSTHTAANVWAVGTRALTDKAGFSLSAAGIDSIIDEVVEGTITVRQAIRLMIGVLGGKSSGGGTATLKFRDSGDAKDRVTATVDANGNRTAVTLDVS